MKDNWNPLNYPFPPKSPPPSLPRQASPPGDARPRGAPEEDESWDAEEEGLYSTSPPCTPRQMKRMSGKHPRNSQGRPAGRSPNKGEEGGREV